jgi:hypothetical protein
MPLTYTCDYQARYTLLRNPIAELADFLLTGQLFMSHTVCSGYTA